MSLKSKSALPTRKWWASTVTLLSGWLVSDLTQGFTEANKIALITILTSRLIAYLVPNEDTPGGVPEKS